MKRRLAVACALAALAAQAKIEMGTPFTDGAVLQRGREVPVWGKAEPGRKVTVAFGDAEVSTIACAKGCWKVMLPAMAASRENRVLKVTESEIGWLWDTESDAVEVKDVLVGEVWFASGQSNMECPIWSDWPRYRDGAGGLLTTMTFIPEIRYVKNDRVWSVEPKALKAKWRPFMPASFKEKTMSAVAFYFARELHLALGVPVGIVDSSWGGTNIDAWTPRCGYDGCDPSLRETAAYKVKADWKAEKDKKGPIGGAQQQPTVLFNGMVDAYAPMAMRGFIWYQGCHNGWESQLYCAKMHALYDGWSKRFENPDLKLYFVQLAPYQQNWTGLVAAQNKFVAEEKNAAIAVTADVGNFDDIHPNNKEIVAKRLAVHALKRDYGFDVPEDDSPVLRKAVFGGGKVTLTFDHAKSWYVYAPNRSIEPAFEVAGTNGVWTAAKLQNVKKDGPVTGTDLVVSAPDVPDPVKVRYMGKNRTMGTLYNQASLPLGPFEAAKK